TDDQTLTLVGNNLSIEDGNTVVLPTADGTETKVNAGTNVTVAGDGSIATPYVVSVATLDDADADPTNELITSANLTGTNLNIIDAGGTTTVDLSSLDNSGTDDQIASEVNITDTAGNFTATEVEGALAELAAASSDDQALSLAGNTLTLEDGGTVDLAPYLDNTDTQDLSIDGTGKIISLVDGGSVTINA
ncbi:hypothetical protein, partial [Sediminicola luteus]